MLQKSFPALTHVDLEWGIHDFPESESKLPVIPERFLRGSSPRLQHLCLSDIAFLQLPTFLLSARNLVTLKLKQISTERLHFTGGYGRRSSRVD